ncbi:MAG: DUF5107 domain-containing protein [Paludibacter sp.]|nr:DUF5107 domain-containing protein [Paludibacter sp.]
MEKITEYLIQSTVNQSEVKAWVEIVNIPTYGIGSEEKNPIFLEKRVYQGSSGVVYPYPVVEKICDEKEDKPYQAVFIENEYLKIMILPELGGRVQMAYDKVKKRHFVYYNQVIKPALVGLTGPWISGGIEFNWPQHHRPSTYLPTDFTIEEHEDGSKTVWCNEVERMFRTKGMAGFRLYPGKAYLEVNVKVYNRTSLPQTFLWWANPAVVVHKDYHSVFPPDVHAVFDHGKRDVSGFPIATGTYYKCDYSAGVDISRYENIPVPTSYMAINSKYDFVGGYEENEQAGLLHVANHHINAGKKQWTWGHGDFGQAWDRNLTDEDGPYIELMTGMYCDNQPDFTWLQPYEEKSWTQYFMPYSAVGLVKNASKDAIVTLHKKNGNGEVVLYTTAVQMDVHIVVKNGNKILFETTTFTTPAEPFKGTFYIGETPLEGVELTVFDNAGKILVQYEEEKKEDKPIPEPAKAAKDPKDIDSQEQLFLTGLHLEQYRHATYHPMDYYLEALSRESGDVRCNNAVGLWYMRRGQFAKAQPYFENAIKTLIERNPNPIDGEPYYNLGWSLKMQGKNDAAYDAFFKSTWSAAQQDAGYYSLAQIDCQRGDYATALDLVERSLIRNWHNHKGRQLKASILRKLHRQDEALEWIDASLQIDKFNMGCRFEQYLALTAKGNTEAASTTMDELIRLMHGATHSYIEYALDFSNAGLFTEAEQLLSILISDENELYPMVYYALGYFASLTENHNKAMVYFRLAGQMKPDYCFPNKLEEVLILQKAIEYNSTDAKAHYYLGNFWYGARQYDNAIACWEKSVEIDDNFPTVLRNLSLAYYNKRNDSHKALECLERAFQLDKTDARILMELDQLYKKLRRSHVTRLALLEQHSELVEQRDDLCVERITLYNQLGKYEIAKSLIAGRKFHPWEGGEGKVTGQFVISIVELAKRAILEDRFADAVSLLKETEHYPLNLGEGKLSNAEENDIHFYFGCAYEGLGQMEKAKEYYEKAIIGSSEPAIAFFYNDQKPDVIFYQGMAWRKLGDENRAKDKFIKLIQHGEKHLDDLVRIDYFAVSLPDLLIWEDDLQQRNQIHCHLVMALGYLGLGEYKKAEEHFDTLKALDINHQGINVLNFDFQKEVTKVI